MLSEGSTMPETGHVSLSEMAAQEGRVAKNSPVSGAAELSEELSTEVGSSVPVSIDVLPARAPIIRIHFMRHAQVRNYNWPPRIYFYLADISRLNIMSKISSKGTILRTRPSQKLATDSAKSSARIFHTWIR